MVAFIKLLNSAAKMILYRNIIMSVKLSTAMLKVLKKCVLFYFSALT